jgi:hypothetical protein
MSVKPPAPLARTNYLSWPPGTGTYDPQADPDNPSYDPSEVLPAGPGYPNYGDLALDMEQYFRPLERVHGMNLHAPGIASGLKVSCTLHSPNVQIEPGIALDASGKHIFLADGGQAEIGPDADVPGTPPELVAVSGTGATLPTTGFTAGSYYVVVQWWETFNSADYASDPNVLQYNDTPWLQILPGGDVNPDIHVVLGEVSLDGSGNVLSAGYGTFGGTSNNQRTNVSIPAQSLQLQRAQSTGTSGAESVAWGEVRSRESGGIEIVTQNTGDQVNVVTSGGGNFSRMGIGANQAVVGNLNNPGVVLDGAAATVYVGAPGNNGDVIVRDAANNQSVVLDGADATVYVGTPGNYGEVTVYDGNNHKSVVLVGDDAHVVVGGPTLNGMIRMLNSNASDTMALDGSSGSAIVQNLTAFANNTIDVNTTLLHCHGTDFCLDGRSAALGEPNARALVDWGQQLVINFNHDYSNGVVINGLQNPVGSFGAWGQESTQIGIISGYIGANSTSDNVINGNATFNFSDYSFSGTSGDFDSSTSWAEGFQGTFTGTPQVLFVDNQFDVTTSDAWSQAWPGGASTSSVTFTWAYNCSGNGYQQWQFLIIGPIAPPY